MYVRVRAYGQHFRFIRRGLTSFNDGGTGSRGKKDKDNIVAGLRNYERVPKSTAEREGRTEGTERDFVRLSNLVELSVHPSGMCFVSSLPCFRGGETG